MVMFSFPVAASIDLTVKTIHRFSCLDTRFKHLPSFDAHYSFFVFTTSLVIQYMYCMPYIFLRRTPFKIIYMAIPSVPVDMVDEWFAGSFRKKCLGHFTVRKKNFSLSVFRNADLKIPFCVWLPNIHHTFFNVPDFSEV